MAKSSDRIKETRCCGPSSEHEIFECPECDNIVLTLGSEDPSMTCHGEPMNRVSDAEMDVQSPDVEDVFFQAFDLPKTGLDVRGCVIDDGPLSANEIADALGYDRSTVTRYLNDLVELDLLQRSSLNREGGGVVNVYHSAEYDQRRRVTLIGFYLWAGKAAELVEEVNVANGDSGREDSDRVLQGVFWESPSSE